MSNMIERDERNRRNEQICKLKGITETIFILSEAVYNGADVSCSLNDLLPYIYDELDYLTKDIESWIK